MHVRQSDPRAVCHLLPVASNARQSILQSPRTVIPGTVMTYAGMKDDAKRADLIAYLATLQ